MGEAAGGRRGSGARGGGGRGRAGAAFLGAALGLAAAIPRGVGGSGADDLIKALGGLAGAAMDQRTHEECRFRCPGGEEPVPRPGWVSRMNGCGTEFTGELDLSGGRFNMTGCCNGHDVCFDTCNTDYDECDNNFKKCMHAKCGADYGDSDACHEVADLYYNGVRLFGCGLYTHTQSEACICPGSEGGAGGGGSGREAEGREPEDDGGEGEGVTGEAKAGSPAVIRPGKYCAYKSILIVRMLVSIDFLADSTFTYKVQSVDWRGRLGSLIFDTCAGNGYVQDADGVTGRLAGKRTKCWRQMEKIMGNSATVETKWDPKANTVLVQGKNLNLIKEADMTMRLVDGTCEDYLGKFFNNEL